MTRIAHPAITLLFSKSQIVRKIAFEKAIASEPTKPLIEVIKESLEQLGELSKV